jgi:hypothetical protein
MNNRREFRRISCCILSFLAIASIPFLNDISRADGIDNPADALPSPTDLPLMADAGTNPTAAASTPASSEDKSSYTLFDPTPAALMRPMIADRPQITDRPYSVDAGHFQIESDVFTYTYSYATFEESFGAESQRVNVINLVDTGIRAGLCNCADLEVGVQPYTNFYEKAGPTFFRTNYSHRVQGTQNIAVRSTINLWGNDGGSFAVGLIPFIVTPTGDRFFSVERVQGGMEVPVEVVLPCGFDVAAEMGVGIDRNQSNSGYGENVFSSVALEHKLFLPNLKGFVEFHDDAPIQLQHINASAVDIGGSYMLNQNCELYTRVGMPITDRYTAYTVVLGLAFRL